MSLRPPLQIGAIIRNARAFNMQNWREAVAPMDDILPTVAELFTLLKQRKVRPVLVGGIALLQYIQGRNTEDIDLILAVSSLKKLPEIQITSEDMYFARGQFKGLQIDFWLTRNPLFIIGPINETTCDVKIGYHAQHACGGTHDHETTTPERRLQVRGCPRGDQGAANAG